MRLNRFPLRIHLNLKKSQFRSRHRTNHHILAALLLVSLVLSGCSVLLGPELPTPIPTQYLPTAIALTMQANGQPGSQPPGNEQPVGLPLDQATGTPAATASETPQPASTVTITPSGPSATPYTLPPPPTPTPTPEIPNAAIEIRNLGAYSKVTTPLHIYAYLKPGAGGRVRIELIGEDDRILARIIKVMDFVPVGAWAVMSMDLDFEIAATAEAAWLKISVDDEFGRTVALNSVPLILLSVGEADIVPPMDVQSAIILEEPTKKTLIQGGKLLVTGLARPSSHDPLLVQMITAEGKQVGMRLAGVDVTEIGKYGTFAAEVPYNIDQPTKVLLTITEGADSINDIIHLTSLEVMLSP